MNTANNPPSGGNRSPRSMSDVTRENVAAMRRLEQLGLAHRSFADRVANLVARLCGHVGFVWVHAALFAGWILWNTLPGTPHFDPYPFIFLVLCVSLEAIFLSSFILISQNYELRISDRRNQLDLQINLLTEQENTKILQLLELIACQVGVIERPDAEVAALEQATRPDALARQIERAYQERAKAKGK